VTIRNIQEANTALLPYVPLVAQLTGKDTTLRRIQPLMKLLDNPQDKLRVIHIAGTSGKTSTAYYLSALLASSGKTVGLTVSPHVDSVTERIQINNEPLSEVVFCHELTEFLAIVQKATEPPSYFELLYAFSLWVFVRHNVDYAVVETGMGGLFDATNVVTRPDKVCVITDIGLDHTHILGTTLPEIATQKIGIVHDHNVVFTYTQNDEVMAVFTNWTNKHHAKLYTTTQMAEEQASGLDFSGVPRYQERNWLLAYKVYKHLREQDNLRSLTSKVLQQTFHTYIPARMDIRKLGGKTIIMDGAHNLQKMSAFVDSFKGLYPGIKPAVLIALKHDKDYQDVVDILSNFAAQIITTTFNSTQDLPVHSMDPHVLAKAFNNKVSTQVIPDSLDAVRALLQAPEPIGIITGSFYLLSEIRRTMDAS
jgi:dihydrofolate synthase/folylpolyglutamate synthase